MTECPQCGGPIYNNSQKVANGWRGPIFKCRDESGCGWVKWPPKNQRGQQGQRNGGGNAPARNTRPLGPLYNECARIAAAVVKLHVKDAAPSDVIAATATIFIQAAQTGAPLATPPKPKPQPEPESEADDSGNSGGEGYGF